jgi:hypothetical protein
MRPRDHDENEQARLNAYRHIIERYLRYVLIRCTGYTNDKTQVQRIAAYALVTVCLLFEKLRRVGDLGSLVELMVKIVGEDPMPELPVDMRRAVCDVEPVFVLDGRMCAVAAAINGVDAFSRELLILYHIERLQVPTLGAAHGMSVDVIDVSLGYAEKQFTELLQGLSGWDDKSKPDVGALLVELADCIDLPWAEALGEFALRYAAEWDGGGTP